LSTCGRMLATMLQTTTMTKIPKKTMPRPFVSFYIFWISTLSFNRWTIILCNKSWSFKLIHIFLMILYAFILNLKAKWQLYFSRDPYLVALVLGRVGCTTLHKMPSGRRPLFTRPPKQTRPPI
jgi:hypothetical protein